jgi:LmbE family N-acetylglucosaminyl deacetylase
MGHRPNDYHPDHRYVGVLMQDAAYMVTVKFFCPDVRQMAKNPVFLYVSDGFQKPNPFQPDIIVATDSVIEKKQDAIWKLQSQIESLWATGNFEKVVPIPTDPEGRAARRKQQDDRTAGRDRAVAQKFRDKLIELYGPEKGKTVQYAEAFEICEYGRRPSADELKKMFPISPEK